MVLSAENGPQMETFVALPEKARFGLIHEVNRRGLAPHSSEFEVVVVLVIYSVQSCLLRWTVRSHLRYLGQLLAAYRVMLS